MLLPYIPIATLILAIAASLWFTANWVVYAIGYAFDRRPGKVWAHDAKSSQLFWIDSLVPISLWLALWVTSTFLDV